MSIQNLTEQLAAIKQRLAVRDKARRDLDRVVSSLNSERARQEGLGQALQKETRDVQKLEGLSLTSLFHEVLGSKDEQLSEKEKLLMNQNSSDTHELLELSEKAGTLQASQREIREAIAAGEAVRASLEKVADALGSARKWGTWDMLGGGIVATSFKHSHI